MTFAWPHLLWLLVAPAALLVWEFRRQRNSAAAAHPKILRAEAGARSLELAAPSVQPTAGRSRPRVWLCVGLALVLAALARPQWGRLEEPVFDQSREILLAMDLSRSMLTPDVPPSRLARAKLLIQSLLEKLQGERVGLAVFSGTAFLQSPLSADYEILSEFLPALGPDFLPEGGTNYRALINTAIAAFGTSGTADRFLIVLSDGEATDDDWTDRMPELKQKGIRVIGLGIGTVAGGMIPDGSGGFVKDERGAVVLSKLESGTLQQLARATGGAYRDASSWIDLAGLIKETVDAGQRGKFIEKNTVRLVERFQWPLAFGFWCLLVSFFSEFPVRPRSRDIKLAVRAAAPKPAAGKLVSTAAVILFLLGAVRFPVAGVAAESSSSNPVAPLSQIVGRVSAADTRTARDWAELGHETVIWGSHLQSEQQPVPEGPVHDALAAVDSGSALDPAATDWPKLRQDLEALLQKPEEQKQQPNQQQNQQQNQDQQQKQDSKQQQQNQQQSDQQQQQQDKKDQQKQDAQNQKQDEQKKQGESAFGDMQKKDEPPQPPPPDSGTQKVGGATEKKDQPPEQTDPSLALPLQKLDQLRNQDSPAQLFQLMDGEKKPAQKKVGKDW